MNSEYTAATTAAAEATTQVFDTNAKTLAEMNICLLREFLALSPYKRVLTYKKFFF